MANQPNPDDTFRSNPLDDGIPPQDLSDNRLQADPELAEGPASNSRVTVFAIAIAVVLGAVFYGLNNSSIDRPGTSPVAQNNAPMPSAAPAMTPNTGPGVTTGAAPAIPQPPMGSPPSTTLPRGNNSASQ